MARPKRQTDWELFKDLIIIHSVMYLIVFLGFHYFGELPIQNAFGVTNIMFMIVSPISMLVSFAENSLLDWPDEKKIKKD